MQANTDRIQTTHVGSLVRPPELVAYMRKRLEREAVDDVAYEQYLTGAVAEVVERQVKAGLSIFNDGEYSKSSWYRYVTERLNGLEYRAVPSQRPKPTPSAGLDFERFRDFYADYQSGQQANTGGGYWVVTGPISYRGQAKIQRDIDNLKAALCANGKPTGFLPVVAPASVLYGLRDEFYGSDEKLSLALGDALRVEYKAITDAGLIVQLDDAWLAAKYNVMVPPGSFSDYYTWAEQKVAALNRALEGIPEEQSRYHVCWGSWNGPHTNDVAAEDICTGSVESTCRQSNRYADVTAPFRDVGKSPKSRRSLRALGKPKPHPQAWSTDGTQSIARNMVRERVGSPRNAGRSEAKRH